MQNLPIFPREGVSLLLLQKIRDEVVIRNSSHWTTDDVSNQIIKPITKSGQCSLVEYLKNNYFDVSNRHPELQVSYDEVCASKASIFISHAWKYRYIDVVSSLETYFETNKDGNSASSTYLWFDLVVNDQWKGPLLPQIWWKTVFLSAIKEIGHTLMVCVPWNTPTTLTRAWCLWELYCTHISGAKLSLQMSSDELATFQCMLRSDPNCVLQSLSVIDLEKSDAGNPDDLRMIFESVRSIDKGFHGVNVAVKTLLREWILESALLLLQNRINDGQNLTYELSRLTDMNTVALVLKLTEKPERALAVFHEIYKAYTALLGEYHPKSSIALSNLASATIDAYGSGGKRMEVEKMFSDALFRLETLIGINHDESVRISYNLGNITIIILHSLN